MSNTITSNYEIEQPKRVAITSKKKAFLKKLQSKIEKQLSEVPEDSSVIFVGQFLTVTKS